MLTDETDNITYNNMHLNNTYSITNNNNVSSNATKTYVIDNISNGSFASLAEFTFVRNELTSKCEINDNNIDYESDISITSKNNFDDSFHLSDCSMPEDTDENETENIREYTTDTNKNKTVNSTLNLTRSSKVVVCDDRNMYVETSDNPKSKLNMCPYCKNLQMQFTRHLESVHKTEEDVKKFRFLLKGKLSYTKSPTILRIF